MRKSQDKQERGKSEELFRLSVDYTLKDFKPHIYVLSGFAILVLILVYFAFMIMSVWRQVSMAV
jgi:hypothetical protein